MAPKYISGQSNPSHGSVHELLSQHSLEDPSKSNPKRTRFLAFLKSRYGYTNEKAVDELERLLKQFYRSNRSLHIHHSRPNFKPPVAK